MFKPENAVVETRTGKIEGRHENGLYVFKGVPYAETPVGELRWFSPQPRKPWKEVRRAQDYGAIAPQPPSRFARVKEFAAEEPQSEDCLFLNVWTPGLDDARRPVMVWVHGGAFCMGSGTHSTYRGGVLASAGDVVLVTINYRLGVLGFLNLNEVTGGEIPATGNEGLLDQVAALEWVKDNIAAFGGDPENVTVFGESAGGMSIACLMIMPKARGLFQKAIIESAVGEIARPLAPSVKVAEEFLKIVGLYRATASAMRSLKIETLLSAQLELAVRIGSGMAPVIPVVDGNILPSAPLDAFAAGTAAQVPVIIGSNLDEQKLFAAMFPSSKKIDEVTLAERLKRLVRSEDVPILIKTYRQARARRGESTEPAEILSAINTDHMFRSTALRMVEAQCKSVNQTYNYLFTWKSPALGGRLGACHALEIGFIFGTHDATFCGSGPAADGLAHQMQDAWTAFARTGDPSCNSLGAWPNYGNCRKTMILGKNSHAEEATYEEERQIWETIGGVKAGAMP